MKESQPEKAPEKLWCKSKFANLVRYVPSGTYFARVRIGDKLIRQSLKTKSITVAKLRLSDLEKRERTRRESQQADTDGKMTFGGALATYRKRVAGNSNLKPRTKFYHEERLKALLKSWPGLEATEIRKLTQTACEDWAAKFSEGRSGTAFNHTIGILRKIVDIGVEAGARYDNPVRAIKRAKVRPKRPQMPSFDEFNKFVAEIERAGGGYSRPCADLVRFLAFGGFRKNEAANIVWRDVDFARGRITVSGDKETGTKNSEVREVPMIADMRQLLERMRAERQGESAEARVMQVRECQKAMDRAASKIGMARITHHDLRHLFATLCIEAGVDIPTVSRWLGHKDGGALAMKVYGHLRDEHSASMAAKVTFAAPEKDGK